MRRGRRLAEIVRRRAIVVVTDWIVAETGNGAGPEPLPATCSSESVEIFRAARTFRLVYVDDHLLSSALDLYQARPDKERGLRRSAPSFVVMKRAKASATPSPGDRHFEQAGFDACSRRPGSDTDGATGDTRPDPLRPRSSRRHPRNSPIIAPNA